MNNSNSSYLGNSGSETKSNLIIPNFGIAFHTNKEGIGGFLGGTFAISYNRTNDFNNTFSYSGKNLIILLLIISLKTLIQRVQVLCQL